MRRLETAALAVIALSTASVIAIAQTSPGANPSGSSSMQLSSAECQSVWNKVNPGAKPSVSGSDVQAYVTDLKKVDTNGDNMISSQEFTSACQQGFVKQASAGTGSTGASSGTSGSSGSAGSSSSGTTHPSK